VRLHGAGKHLAKGEASRILHHLVVEDFIAEVVKKSDFYGSVSSVLKVSKTQSTLICLYGAILFQKYNVFFLSCFKCVI